jgi:hypothetical protein
MHFTALFFWRAWIVFTFLEQTLINSADISAQTKAYSICVCPTFFARSHNHSP